MNNISQNQQYKDFVQPDTLVETEVCKLSGLLPNEACRKDYRGSYVVKDFVDLSAIGNKTCNTLIIFLYLIELYS